MTSRKEYLKQKQKELREKRAADGFTQLTVWVPSHLRDKIKDAVQKFVDKETS